MCPLSPEAAAVALGVLGLAAAAVVAYYLVVTTEGAYLGPRAVRFIYNWGAATYDGVKDFDRLEEYMLIGRPLLDRIESSVGAEVVVLDIASGTGRLPLALAQIPGFEGAVVGIDFSRDMLREARRKTEAARAPVELLECEAAPLPFATSRFGAVTMMEALEFLPDRDLAISEAARVLVPGGWLLITNRIGLEAQLMPGRTESPAYFEKRLCRIGLTEVSTWPWQSYYDLVWARKPRGETGRLVSEWHGALICPGCGAVGGWIEEPIEAASGETTQISCRTCGYVVGQHQGIWQL